MAKKRETSLMDVPKEAFIYFLKSKMTVHKMFLDLTCISIKVHNGAKSHFEVSLKLRNYET